jgi:hypothetical protein
MKTTLATILIGLALCVSAGAQSLNETVEWMHNTLAPIDLLASSRNGYSILAQPMSGHYVDLLSDVSHDGCQMTVIENYDMTGDYFVGGRSEFAYEERDTFNLADIDPTTVKVPDNNPYREELNGKVINLFTVNNRGAIKCQVKTAIDLDREGNPDKDLKSSADRCVGAPYNNEEFRFQTHEYAVRFAKALRHAVTLCGGKASTF